MLRKAFLSISIFCLTSFIPLSHAEEFVIKDYTFTWRVAKAGFVKMAIQKDPVGLRVVLSSMGGPLATLSLAPYRAKAIGEALAKTGDYYNRQKKSEDRKSVDSVRSGEYRLTFSSSQGDSFEVKIDKPAGFSAAVLLTKDEALMISGYLRNAEKMVKLVNARIKP